jgi:hypothetical protein
MDKDIGLELLMEGKIKCYLLNKEIQELAEKLIAQWAKQGYVVKVKKERNERNRIKR